MRVLTEDQLNDPSYFNTPDFDAEKKASYKRAVDLCNSINATVRASRLTNAKRS